MCNPEPLHKRQKSKPNQHLPRMKSQVQQLRRLRRKLGKRIRKLKQVPNKNNKIRPRRLRKTLLAAVVMKRLPISSLKKM